MVKLGQHVGGHGVCRVVPDSAALLGLQEFLNGFLGALDLVSQPASIVFQVQVSAIATEGSEGPTVPSLAVAAN